MRNRVHADKPESRTEREDSIPCTRNSHRTPTYLLMPTHQRLPTLPTSSSRSLRGSLAFHATYCSRQQDARSSRQHLRNAATNNENGRPELSGRPIEHTHGWPSMKDPLGTEITLKSYAMSLAPGPSYRETSLDEESVLCSVPGSRKVAYNAPESKRSAPIRSGRCIRAESGSNGGRCPSPIAHHDILLVGSSGSLATTGSSPRMT